MLKIGIIGKFRKENEKRVPIHPEHLVTLPEAVKKHLLFESGYGVNFNASDDWLAGHCGGVVSRKEVIENSDVITLAKPVADDLLEMKTGQTLWGWAHLVQQRAVTQAAIDRKLTVITWETMNRWTASGDWQMHIFQKNNEIAGYAGVLDAARLKGINGTYGPKRKCAVINFGSVSRGSVIALQRLGFTDITVFTLQPPHLIGNQAADVRFEHLQQTAEGLVATIDGCQKPFIQIIADMDIIVNGILQDPNQPLMFVNDGEDRLLKKNALIIDISCDEGMGFYFARPTTISDPMFRHNEVDYYSVDHTPSLLWDSASWEISRGLVPYLETVMGGPAAWSQEPVIEKAVEMREGRIINPKILTFQNRDDKYPHLIKEAVTV